MTISHAALDRRTLCQAGLLAASVGFTRLGAERADAGPPASVRPVTGPLIGWLLVTPDGAGRLTLIELDACSRPVRQAAVEAVRSAASLTGAARHANDAALRWVAASWDVPVTDCAGGRGWIEHRRSGRCVPFALWTDFA